VSLSDQVLFWEVKTEIHMVQGRENMEDAAEDETGALVFCHLGFAKHLSTTLLLSCGLLHSGDPTEIANNTPYVLFDPLERTHGAQHCLDHRKLLATLFSCFKLGEFSWAMGMKEIFNPVTGPSFRDRIHRCMFHHQ
jgi:hypothetical protein